MRKRIGIVGVLDSAPDDSPFRAWKRDITSQAYTESVVLAGGLPFHLPLLDDLSLIGAQLEDMDGIVLQGGNDIDPSLYGEKNLHSLGVDIFSDQRQIMMVRMARELDLPVFGICKGCQIINVAFGGSLYQDYSQCPFQTFPHKHYANATKACHGITLNDGLFLKNIFHSDTLLVNSLHHQAVKKVGEGLHVAATCTEDGIVEALESTDHKTIAVQWHPEAMMKDSSFMLPLWEYFISLC